MTTRGVPSDASDDRLRFFGVTFEWGDVPELDWPNPSRGGWLRVGEHFAEFQLVPPRPRRRLFTRDIHDVKTSAVDLPSPPPVVVAPARHDPMWDRLLDG